VQRASGIGGVFLRARDPEALRAWYEASLGKELGRFGWAVDPEGNRLELWEPAKR
jgi:catechol 2,3-dioxygenase-like lactoylglutathione lyase family enzyme